MNVRTIIQQALDKVLLPYGVLSHHLRRVETDYIDGGTAAVNKDEYVVYRVVSDTPRSHGDGRQRLFKVYIDVNYYYSYEKTDPRYISAESRLQAVKREILTDRHFRIANDVSDVPDVNNPYRGLNVEFAYIGVSDNE